MTATRPYYRDCSELSIYRFSKVLGTGDYTYLLKPNDGEKVVLTEGEIAFFGEVWSSIYEEYCKLAEDNKSLMYFALQEEVVYLTTRYEFAAALLDQIIIRQKTKIAIDEYIDTLADWGYHIKKDKPLQEEMNRMYKQLRGSQNKIRLKKDELEKFMPEDEEEKLTLTEQIVKLELATGKNNIDPHKTSVEKFVVMIKEMSKSRVHGRTQQL